MSERYLVYGFYTDEPQVVVDLIDAESDDAAEAAITHARAGDKGSGYQCDGAELLADHLVHHSKLVGMSSEKVAQDVAALAENYAHYHEDEPCPVASPDGYECDGTAGHELPHWTELGVEEEDDGRREWTDDGNRSQWQCQCGWTGPAPDSETCPKCNGGLRLVTAARENS